MASRNYDNPWARGVNTLTNAFIAREQGLAEQAAAQREAEIEAQRWAAEHGLDVQRTDSQLARDQSSIGLDDMRGRRIETLLPHEVDNLQARSFASRASGQSSLASAQNTQLRSAQQRLINLAAQNNMDITGGRATEVMNPGQSQVANAEQLVQLNQQIQGMQQLAGQLPEDDPQQQVIAQNLAVLQQGAEAAQSRFDMTTSTNPGELLTQRTQVALRKLDAAGGDESVLSPAELRDVETFYASQPQTDAGVEALTSSQQGKRVNTLADLQTSALNLDDAMGQTLELIEQGGDKLRGIPAGLIQMTDSLRGAVTGISDLTGLIDQEDAAYLDRITSGLTENASDARSLQALLSDVAIMNYRLKNPNDPRMSDFDLRVQLRPLESGSARAIQGFIQDMRARIPQFYDNAVRSTMNTGTEVPEPLRTIGRGAPAPEQQAPSGELNLGPEDEALINQYLN